MREVAKNLAEPGFCISIAHRWATSLQADKQSTQWSHAPELPQLEVRATIVVEQPRDVRNRDLAAAQASAAAWFRSSWFGARVRVFGSEQTAPMVVRSCARVLRDAHLNKRNVRVQEEQAVVCVEILHRHRTRSLRVKL